MGNSFTPDILIQAEDLGDATRFYVQELGFEVTETSPKMVSLRGDHLNFFIEQGPALGPVLEVTVPDLASVRARLVRRGCIVVKDEPNVPRCYVRDPFGATYNLTEAPR